MRNEKVFFIFLVLGSSLLMLFYFWGLRKEFRGVSEEKKAEQENAQKLKAQLKGLEEYRDSLSKSEEMLGKELKKEREKVRDLDGKLRESAEQGRLLSVKLEQARSDGEKLKEVKKEIEELLQNNQKLKSDLDEARRKFEFIEPLKDKLSGVESALGALELKKGKEELLSVQLGTISSELKSVNNYMLQLLENNVSPIRSYASSTARPEEAGSGQDRLELAKYRAESEKLKSRLEKNEGEQVSLKQRNQDLQLELENGRRELNARSEKMLALQEKIMSLENRIFEVQSSFKEMEKDAAVLREKYVAGELEKSALQIALDQTRQELSTLQAKFLSLLNKIGGIFKSGEEAQLLKEQSQAGSVKSNSAKIDVKLMPQGAKEVK